MDLDSGSGRGPVPPESLFVCMHPLLPSFLPSSPCLPPFLSSSGKISLSRSLDLTYSTVEVPIGQSLRIRSTNYVVGVDLSPFMEDIILVFFLYNLPDDEIVATHTHTSTSHFIPSRERISRSDGVGYGARVMHVCG